MRDIIAGQGTNYGRDGITGNRRRRKTRLNRWAIDEREINLDGKTAKKNNYMTSEDLSNIIAESINSVDLDKLKNEKMEQQKIFCWPF